MTQTTLVCLFCVSAGKNGENLGTDEEQIVQLIYLLYDTGNNKILSVQEFYVRPTVRDDVTETVLTDECKQTTGLTERDVQNGQSLEQVLDELDRFLRTKEIHPQQGGKPFCFVTDGPLHLRMALHPEAFHKNITLAPYFFKYHDLRKQFKHFYKPDRNIANMDDMMSFLSLSADQSVGYGIRHCQDMAHIIHRLIIDGHSFTESEHIMDRLEPGILNKSDAINDDTIVKARGLPWQSSEQDITNFFRGLNVAKGGVALCLSQQGRRNGEALVRFETAEQRSLALRRHKHHLGQRYIEVYKATARDFLSVAGGGSREAQAFLSHQSWNGTQVIVRMRGLPYTCRPEQVIQFFSSGPTSVEVLDGEEGVLFVHQADGRATGDAFVLFASEEEANRALTKHKQLIGTRYIELFKSTTAEVQQVLNRSMDPRTPVLESRDTSTVLATTLLPPFAFSHLPGLQTAAATQQIIPGGSQKDCIRLRGLPFEAQVGDIIQFLGELSNDIVCQGVHLIYKAEGTPSGEAFIQMNSEMAAKAAALSKHNKTMFLPSKKRSIEVIQCSGEEMTFILNSGLFDTAALASIQTSANALVPAAFATTYWPTMNSVPNVNRSAIGLQTRQTLIETAPSFFSSVLASPSPVAQTSFLYPTGQLPLHASVLTTATPASSSVSPNLPSLPPHVIALQQVSAVRQPMTAAMAPSMAAFQPMVYLYPAAAGASPLSPTAASQQNATAFYLPLSPSSVAVKGLPPTIQAQDILTFLDGSYENPPDVQLLRGPDGRPTGEAIVTFLSRTEADRAVSDKNRQVFANRIVEVRSVC